MAKIQFLGDIFAELDAEAIDRTRREMAIEKAEWEALPQSERDRITAEREAKYDAMWAAVEAEDDDEDDEDEEEDE